MTIELELQIRQRIKEIGRLLKTVPEEAALHYRDILNDEVVRLRKELTRLAPLDNLAYMSGDEQSDALDDNETAQHNRFDLVDNFYSGKIN